jgi:hypothetical protein
MRKFVAFVVIALAALAVTGRDSIPTASAHGGGDIMLTEKTVSEQFLDLGDEGEGAGDQFVFKGDLTDADGADAGHSMGHCVLVSADGIQCTGTLALEHGTMSVAGGGIGDGDKFAVAIVGGTGDYRGATGELEVKHIDGETAELTVHLD